MFDPSWPAEVQVLYHHDMRETWGRSIAPHVWKQHDNQLRFLGYARSRESAERRFVRSMVLQAFIDRARYRKPDHGRGAHVFRTSVSIGHGNAATIGANSP